MIRLYRLTPGGVEALDVAYVVPGLLQSAGITLVTEQGRLVGGVKATPLPVLPPTDDSQDWTI